MKHISEVMRLILLKQLDKINEDYQSKKISKTEFDNLVNTILDKINEIDKKNKK